MTINGKVAGIVSPTLVAINVGARDGVKVDDKVRVYRQVDVKDPDSKEELGSVVLTKVNLKITFVDDRFSVGETVDNVSRGGLTTIYSGSVFGESQQIAVTLSPREADSGTVLIAIGDPVFVERDEKAAPKPTAKDAQKSQDQPKSSTG